MVFTFLLGGILLILTITLILNYKTVLSINRIEQDTRLDIIDIKDIQTPTKVEDEVKETRLSLLLQRAGITDTAAEFVMKWVVLFVGLSFVGSLLVSQSMIVVALFIVALGIPLKLIVSSKKRGELFDAQLASTLPTIAQLLRAGRTFESGIAGVVDTSDDPLQTEFRKATQEIAFDNNTPAALERIAKRTGSGDMVLLSSACKINTQYGGNFADTIDMVASTIRVRESLKRMVRSETSSTKASALAIVVIQLIIVALLILGNEVYADFYLGTPIGFFVLTALTLYELIGILVMWRVTCIDLA